MENIYFVPIKVFIHSFSDKADLQQHRRTAHFLANSNRKSWVASAMDQCHVCEKPFQTQETIKEINICHNIHIAEMQFLLANNK